METLDIIQRLLKEQHISVEEAMTLVRDIKVDEKMNYISTPFPVKPNKQFVLFEDNFETISTNEYPIDSYIKSE